MYHTSQKQTQDIVSFGMILLLMTLTVGMTKSLFSEESEPEINLLPMAKAKKPVVTVECPICSRIIDIPDYGTITRTEALRRHIEKEHAPGSGLHRLPAFVETGECVPPRYRHLIGWLNAPIPGYSLNVDLLPSVDVETGEKKIDAVMKQLQTGVESIQSSDQFRLFLTTMSKFHDYSIGNQILIMFQRPDATRVAGFTTWRNLGRWVKKGEKGIAILAPVMPPRPVCPACGGKVAKNARYCPNCGEALEEMVDSPRFFRVVYVFDVSQTEGKPLPEFAVPVLTGEANEDLFTWLRYHLKQKEIPLDFSPKPDLNPGVKGYYSREGIWIRPEEPAAQQLKTLLHEVAHYYSEDVFRLPRADAETIAESTAYVVGAHFGFDTGVRSFPYVALWAQDKKVLENNLGAIRKVSTTMINALSEIQGMVYPQVVKAWN